MAIIKCKWCNESFHDIIQAYRHLCLNNPTAHKKAWKNTPGAKGNRNNNSPEDIARRDKDYPNWLSKENIEHLRLIRKYKLEGYKEV